jgi:exonuclease
MEGHTSVTDWTSLNYVAVDVEGNGQQPPDLVELAVVPVVAGVIGEPRSWLVRPETPITPFARRIHGITNEQVAEAPVFADIRDDVLSARRTARRMTSWSRPGCSSGSPRCLTPVRCHWRNCAVAHRKGAAMKLQPCSDHSHGLFVSVDGPGGAGKDNHCPAPRPDACRAG